jgi:hypothetical protein
VNNPTLVFVFWSKITLLGVLYGKSHRYDTKCTCPTEVIIVVDKCSAINVPKYEGRMLF